MQKHAFAQLSLHSRPDNGKFDFDTSNVVFGTVSCGKSRLLQATIYKVHCNFDYSIVRVKIACSVSNTNAFRLSMDATKKITDNTVITTELTFPKTKTNVDIHQCYLLPYDAKLCSDVAKFAPHNICLSFLNGEGKEIQGREYLIPIKWADHHHESREWVKNFNKVHINCLKIYESGAKVSRYQKD